MSGRIKGAANFALRVVCLLAAFACAALLLWQWNTHRKGARANQTMQELYDPPAGAEEALPETQEIFDRLLEANPDTVGYLKATETIDFAVVKRDNEYYLTHNFFGESTPEGTAFMDEGNCLYPCDEHLLIHGHNMKNGSVFGDLDQYRELAFLREHSLIAFDTIYADAQYVPVAVFDMSATPSHRNFLDMQRFRFETDEEFDEFVAQAREKSYFEIPIDVQRGDRLLSLATCSYFDENGRFILMLRALRPQEDFQEMAALVGQAVEK